jgi:hypothetical protein
MREITMIHNPNAEQEEWRAEDFNCGGEGNTDLALFAGPFAEPRARGLPND